MLCGGPVLAPVYGNELSRNFLVPCAGVWMVADMPSRQYSQNGYSKLDEVETKGGSTTPWNGNQVGVMCSEGCTVLPRAAGGSVYQKGPARPDGTERRDPKFIDHRLHQLMPTG